MGNFHELSRCLATKWWQLFGCVSRIRNTQIPKIPINCLIPAGNHQSSSSLILRHLFDQWKTLRFSINHTGIGPLGVPQSPRDHCSASRQVTVPEDKANPSTRRSGASSWKARKCCKWFFWQERKYTNCHGNPKPSFLGVITHILGVLNLHFSWFWGPRVESRWRNLPCIGWTHGPLRKSPPNLGVASHLLSLRSTVKFRLPRFKRRPLFFPLKKSDAEC